MLLEEVSWIRILQLDLYLPKLISLTLQSDPNYSHFLKMPPVKIDQQRIAGTHHQLHNIHEWITEQACQAQAQWARGALRSLTLKCYSECRKDLIPNSSLKF